MAAKDGYPLISPVTQELADSSWKPTGDTLDHAWYRSVLLPSGKPHLAAIAILGRVVYMYRPVVRKIINDDGLVVGTEIRQKFAADAWQCSREALADMFGFGIREVDAALGHLDKELGVIKRERRTVVINGVRCSNVLYLCLNVSKLKEISTPITSERNSSPAETEDLSPRNVIAPPPKRKTYTKISQQTSPKNNSSKALPSAAVFLPSQKNQNLNPEIEVAILALPPEHQANALDVCRQEDAEDQVKLDALYLFSKKLRDGKANDCGWLRQAVKGKWGGKEREKERQKSVQREHQEAKKRAEAEWQELQEAALEAKREDAYKQYLRLPIEAQAAVKAQAEDRMQRRFPLDPGSPGVSVLLRNEIIDFMQQPQVL